MIIKLSVNNNACKVINVIVKTKFPFCYFFWFFYKAYIPALIFVQSSFAVRIILAIFVSNVLIVHNGMKRIAIFASGTGTNAENIIRYFAKSENASVVLVLSNKLNAGVHARANALGVPSFVFTREEFAEGDEVIKKLAEYEVDFIVLAGFLCFISESLRKAYPRRIVNIHPALLPKFGGKGMYGMHVHEAVVKSGEKESGITIHYINEHYDEGAIIFQASCPVAPGDTPEDVAGKVHALEYEHYPRVVEEVIEGLSESEDCIS